MTSLAELKAAMLLVLLASTAAPLVAVAQTAPKTPPVDRKDLVKLPKPTDLKPTGPVTLTSDKAELVQGNSAVYTGNVVLSSDTLKLEGDRVELKQYAGGQYEAKITGGPAKMNHAGNGADNPPVSARAKTLNYDSRSGVLDLISDAYVMRGNDEITGDTIKYDVNQRRIQASGGTGGQVKIILQPSSSEPAAPVAVPGAAP
jgi:lipopolysaccharide export system protein LptA